MEKIASFEVQDAIVVVDPCYKQDNNLDVAIQARKGKWVAFVNCDDDGVNFINARHINFFGGVSKEIGNAPVDSGQLGIWDKDFWKSNNNGGSYDDKNSWYGAVCDVTQHLGAGQFGRGAVTSTGGDGYFPIYATFDKNGKAVSVTVHLSYGD